MNIEIKPENSSQIPVTLPPEELGYIADKTVKAERRIITNPYDVDAWNVLIKDAQVRNIVEARKIYERIVLQFPNCGRYWKMYIEHEMRSHNFEKVEKLFQRCLMKVLNIDLWKTYLNYIKETKGKLSSFREKMAQAYDFALDKIGMDINSYSIWTDYIRFLKSVEAIGSYAETQRLTAVRKIYQKGVITPMSHIDQLWKDYCIWEQSINPMLAKKMQEERGKDFLNAKRVTKEYELISKGLNKSVPSIPPKNTPDELKQVELWKKYINWEKQNPLRTEDKIICTKRVMFAYEQCLLCLSHYPNIWLDCASFLEESSRLLVEKGDQHSGKMFLDEVTTMYERAITGVLKNNTLLYFAYADFEESRSKNEKASAIYKRAIEESEIDPTLAYILFMRFCRRTEGFQSSRTVFREAREHPNISYHVFVSAADIEYYCNKDSRVAVNIFELGLKRFSSDPNYLKYFLDFMSHLNEDNNTRVLYERFLQQLDASKSQ